LRTGISAEDRFPSYAGWLGFFGSTRNNSLNQIIPSRSTTVTRIAAGDDRTRYDNIAIMLHWLTALLVVLQFALSQTWGLFDRPVRHDLIVTHTSFGVLLAAVIVARLIWRLMPGHQVSAANSGWLEIASKSAHYLLYVLLVTEAILGFVLGFTGKSGGISFFGLMIPSPLGPLARESRHLIGETHEWIAWAIIILATGHALAALFHHYVLKDGLLSRMLPANDE
jgi:cytochrome b561